MDAASKDLVNASSGGSFEKLRLSKAKIVLGRLLDAKKGYEETALAPSQENVNGPTGEVRDNLLEIRVDKLEEILQLVCKKSQHPIVPIQPYFQVDQVNHQSTGGDWSPSLRWSPEGQAEEYQLEHPPCGEWSQSRELSTIPYNAEPHQASIQTPTWPMEYPNYQPYPKFQSQKFDPPTFQPNQPSHCTFISSHPYQTHSLEARDHFPTWSKEEWQTSRPNHHQNQTCPDQLQNQSHQQQSFEPTSEESHYTNSTAGEVEKTTEFQVYMQSCTGSEAEIVMNMPRSYKEQQSQMDVIIRQVALLTEMLKEVQEIGAISKSDGKSEENEVSTRVEDKSPADAEKRLETSLEKAGDAGTDSDEEEGLREEEVTPYRVKFNVTLLYLKEEKVHKPSEKVDEYPTEVKGEKNPEERPSPETNKAEGGYREEGEPRAGRSRSKAARSIYWVQLQPWPEPLGIKKPPYSGLRPKENKKVQGTYRHHKKKRVSN